MKKTTEQNDASGHNNECLFSMLHEDMKADSESFQDVFSLLSEDILSDLDSIEEAIGMNKHENNGNGSGKKLFTSEETIVISEEERDSLVSSNLGALGDTIKDTFSSVRRKNVNIENTLHQFHRAAAPEKQFFYEIVDRKSDDDKFECLEKLVSGGMGEIYKVLDQDLKRISAMKVILPNYKNDKSTLDDFVREARITGLLEHPNIIPVHELGFHKDSGIYFTMKLARGETLNDILIHLKNEEPEYLKKFTTYHLLSIFRKVCDALAYAHSENIIHQDIKPHNIIVGKHGDVLLMDWGLARYTGNPEKETNPVKKDILAKIFKKAIADDDRQIKGTPSYMSPEQVQGDIDSIDKQTDIFLLGATLYHMFTLEAPYAGNDIYEVLYEAEHGNLIPPEVRNPARQIPGEICRIIKKAMAFVKEERYQTVETLIQDVDDLISGKWSRQEKKVFRPGEMLMQEGEVGEEAYLILSGKVQVFKVSDGHKVVLSKLGKGSIIGEMALITHEPRSASIEALEKTEVSVLTARHLSENLKKLPPFMEKIVATLSERLRLANTRIHPHLTQDCTYFILQQLRLIFKDRSGFKIGNIKIPVPEIVEEISDNLAIPHHQVKKVISRAVKRKILSMENHHVHIADFNRLSRLTRLVGQITKE